MSSPPVLLELGAGLAPAAAGAYLAEQGLAVVKWTTGADPLQGLRDGERLWRFYTAAKRVERVHARHVPRLLPGLVDAVLDNHTPDTWARWGIDPDAEAARLEVPWVSIVADVPDPQSGQRSFDAFAQARAFGRDCPPVPFRLGDTAAGMAAAMVLAAALAQGRTGRLPVHHATALAKLRAGELAERPPPGGWDEPGAHEVTAAGATVEYREARYFEPARDDTWRLEHLRHHNGRLTIGARER